MDIDKTIKLRHSVRKFSTKSVSWRDILKAIDSARLAPLAGNLNAMRFILVENNDKIKKLAQACQQGFVASVPYIVVVCSDKEQLIRSYDDSGIKFAAQQSGAAIENLWLKLVSLGLSTCWVGAFADEQVKHILNIPDSIEVEEILTIAYELDKGKQRVKPNLDEVLFFDSWKNKYMEKVEKPEAS